MKKFFLFTVFIVTNLFPALSEGQTLGRLFFTPQERRQIEANRNASNTKPTLIAARPPVKTTLAPNETLLPLVPPAPKQTVINGFVRRSDGPNTVWVNEKPVSGNAAREEWLQPSAVNSPVRLHRSGR